MKFIIDVQIHKYSLINIWISLEINYHHNHIVISFANECHVFIMMNATFFFFFLFSCEIYDSRDIFSCLI